jgi:hypothetical protein
MHDSGVDQHIQVIKNRATGHICDGPNIYQTPYREMPFMNGAGSLYSTVLDLLKWDQALYTEKLVSQESLDKIFTSYNEAKYGYGWFIDERYGRKLITHRGGINGFLTNIDRFVEDSVTVITLFNYESTFAMAAARALSAMAMGQEYQPLFPAEIASISPDTLAMYPGTYELTNGTPVTVEIAGDTVCFIEEDGTRHTSTPYYNGTFWVRGFNSIARFEFGEDGTVSGFSLRQGVHGMRASKQM